METRRLSKHEIIDLIISKATLRTGAPFTGDKRDGEAPAITFQNFRDEAIRLAAKALRARLSRLSRAEVLAEGRAAFEHHNMWRQWISQRLAREHRERQAERGRKHGLQPEILAAARHYRGCKVRGRKMYAVEAWNAIKKEPYQTSDGDTVMIEDGALWVQSRAGKQKRSRIKIAQWQKRYWVAAKS